MRSRDAASPGSIGRRPVVSVVVPTYNRWHLVGDAIESVFRQRYTEWEVVVVNDGGEKPGGRGAAFLKNGKVRYVEHPSNRGLAAARNTGIEASRGELIAYLDDDDVFYPDHLEVLAGEIVRNGWDVAYADSFRALTEGTDDGVRVLEREILDSRDFDPALIWKDNFIPVLSVVHRRACLEKTGLFDTGLPCLEDWDLWLRMSLHYRFHHVPEATSEYRVRSDGSNMTERENRRIQHVVKARIYGKHLADSQAAGGRTLRRMVGGGVSRLAWRYHGWFAGKLADPGERSTFRPLYDVLPPEGKLLLFALHPAAMSRYLARSRSW